MNLCNKVWLIFLVMNQMSLICLDEEVLGLVLWKSLGLKEKVLVLVLLLESRVLVLVSTTWSWSRS